MLQLTKLNRKKHKECSEMDYDIPGYTLHPVNLDNETGRGIAVYSKDTLDKSVIQIESDLTFEEVCLLEVRLRGGDVLLFGCIYRSPTPSLTSDQNNEKLNRLLKCISNKKYSHRCIVGDFNFKHINWSSWSTPHGENSVEEKFIEAARDSYLQHVEKPTRRRGHDDPSLLDLILTDESMQVSEIAHHAPLGKSDHSVISFDFNCYLDFSKPRENYSFDKGDYVGMRYKLANSNWMKEYMKIDDKSTVEDKWLSLKSMLSELRTTFVPKQKISGKPSWKDKGSFPMDTDTRKAIKSKSKAYRTWMAAKTNPDRNTARLLYLKERNKTKTLLRKSKILFEKGMPNSQKVTQRLSGNIPVGN